MVEINSGLSIPESEITYVFSPSSGPGGQNVNKVSTRVTLLFDVGGSPSLSEDERDRILNRLRTRITRQGILRVVSQRHRSQRANREAALERFQELMRVALAGRRTRKPTAVPHEVRERRLAEKKRRGLLKASRSRTIREDE